MARLTAAKRNSLHKAIVAVRGTGNPRMHDLYWDGERGSLYVVNQELTLALAVTPKHPDVLAGLYKVLPDGCRQVDDDEKMVPQFRKLFDRERTQVMPSVDDFSIDPALMTLAIRPFKSVGAPFHLEVGAHKEDGFKLMPGSELYLVGTNDVDVRIEALLMMRRRR